MGPWLDWREGTKTILHYRGNSTEYSFRNFLAKFISYLKPFSLIKYLSQKKMGTN